MAMAAYGTTFAPIAVGTLSISSASSIALSEPEPNCVVWLFALPSCMPTNQNLMLSDDISKQQSRADASRQLHTLGCVAVAASSVACLIASLYTACIIILLVL